MSTLLIIARNEVRIRFSSKIIVFTLLSLFVSVAILPWVPGLINGKSNSIIRIGVVVNQTSHYEQQEDFLKQQAFAKGFRLIIVHLANFASIEKGLSKQHLAAALSLRKGNYDIYAQDGYSPAIVNLLEDVSRSLAINDFLVKSGIPVTSVLDFSNSQRAHLSVIGTKKPEIGFSKIVVGLIALVLLYSLLMMAGTSLVLGVVEEKSSKVMEIILSAVKPRDLLMGKVLGISIFMVVQFLALVLVGLLSAWFAGSLGNIHLSVILFFELLVWFVPAFLFFGFIFMGLGATISRMEDLGAIQAPIMLVLMICFYAGMFSMTSESSTWVRILSYFSPFSFFIEPTRMITNSGTIAEFCTSLLVSLLSLLGIVRLSIYLFERSILGAK